ncbi:conserved hypothetical protein [Bathymodiolus platifrons methanotrophic gill symbiont]|nr:conserved hypothetical protein [Bathymodiolus platifrons methanotrophic gill symbiont]
MFRAYSLDYIALLNKEKQGNWDEAHQQIQPYSGLMACLIHGYLHRVEGDLDNAQYWYNRADTNIPDNTLEQEWQRLYELAHSD